MDPVTHITSGLIAAQAVRTPRWGFPAGRWLLLFGAAVAWLPDIDNLASLLGPEAYIRLHRGLTHSLLGGAVLAFLCAAAVRARKKDVPFGPLSLFALGLIGLHLFLDVITNYGTQLFLPFSDARVAVPAVFIVDPLFTGSLLAIALLAAFLPRQRAMYAYFGLIWLILYPLTNLGLRQAVTEAWQAKLAAAGLAATATVQPDALAPVHWKVVVDEGQTYRMAGIDLFFRGDVLPERTWPKADRALLAALGRQAPFFDTWSWFAVFPAVIKEETAPDGSRTMTFADLRFLTTTPLAGRFMNRDLPPFALSAVFDAAGRLTAWIYHDHGKTLAVGAGQ